MDENKEAEKKTTEEGKTQEAASGTDDANNGNSSEKKTEVKTTPLIDIANQAAQRMEDANKETARLQAVQAERDQRIALGGSTKAGQEAKKAKETPAQYTQRIQNGEKN